MLLCYCYGCGKESGLGLLFFALSFGGCLLAVPRELAVGVLSLSFGVASAE